MKPFTKIERQELREKIEAVTGGRFEHPLPELFLSAENGLDIYPKVTLNPSKVPWLIIYVLARVGGRNIVHQLGRFGCN